MKVLAKFRAAEAEAEMRRRFYDHDTRTFHQRGTVLAHSFCFLMIFFK